MKKLLCILYFCMTFIIQIKADFINEADSNGERKIVIVTAGYNNKKWYKDNLDSVFNQRYLNYHLIYTDDCSTDGTPELVGQYIRAKGFEHKVTLIKNTERCGALFNQYRAIHSCNDKDIIIILDADDCLAHENVLSFINKTYSDNNIWLTYGQYIELGSKTLGFCSPYPQYIIERNAFREWAHTPSHLRTFYAGLFKQIKIEDLSLNGRFFTMTGDMAAMIPMIEMARDHFRFIPEILYIYNETNDINDHKVCNDLQKSIADYIRNLLRYTKVISPIINSIK